MKLGGTVYEYDTTDLEKVDNKKLIESIKERLNGIPINDLTGSK